MAAVALGANRRLDGPQDKPLAEMDSPIYRCRILGLMKDTEVHHNRFGYLYSWHRLTLAGHSQQYFITKMPYLSISGIYGNGGLFVRLLQIIYLSRLI